MDRELKNFIRFNMTPSHGIRFAKFGFEKLLNRFQRKIVGKTFFYRKSVRSILPSSINNDVFIQSIHSLWPNTLSGENKDTKVNSIELASLKIVIKENIPWELTFDDDEDLVSLHRWNWLLTCVLPNQTKQKMQWAIAQLLRWISTFINKRDTIIWESYTTGERISNSLIFFSAAGIIPSTPMVSALIEMGLYLTYRLEYFGKENTSNHVINNARALYFAGQFLSQPRFSDIARAILLHDLESLLSNDGFLREGSSHYQFLFTRWLLEVYAVSLAYGDNKLSEWLQPLAHRLIRSCWFFLVQKNKDSSWNFPLIGDISPDFTPEWLLDLPWSDIALSLYKPSVLFPPPKAQGWGRLAGRTQSDNSGLENYLSKDTPLFYPESGWYRIDYSGSTLICHVEPTGSAPFPSHGHCDIGSFSLYRNGEPVLIDPGRLHYRQDLWGIYGQSGAGHNTLRIDGLDPFPVVNRGKYPHEYRCSPVKVKWDKKGDVWLFQICHYGFNRIVGDTVFYCRKFFLGKDRLVIEDEIFGRAEHMVETRFHWAPDFSVERLPEDCSFTISTSDFSLMFLAVNHCHDDAIIYRGQEGPEIAGWSFSRYGHKEPTSTLVFRQKVVFPCIHRYEVRWY